MPLPHGGGIRPGAFSGPFPLVSPGTPAGRRLGRASARAK